MNMSEKSTSYGVIGTSALDLSHEQRPQARIIPFPVQAQTAQHSSQRVDEGAATAATSPASSSSQNGYIAKNRSDAAIVWDALGIEALMSAAQHLDTSAYTTREWTVADKAVLVIGFLISCIVVTL